MTTALSAPHLPDIALAVLLALTLYGVRHRYAVFWGRIVGASHDLSRRVALCVVLAALLPVAWRLAVLPWLPPPQPQIHDEFGHLLVADTLIAGRLANPPHPLWRHLDTIYVIQKPSYASTYPLGQGFFLAAGRILFGHPWAGVLLSSALMSGAICWMLFGCLPRKWGAVGGLLAALAPGVAVDWQETYYGGAIGAAGGALLAGALFRWLESPSRAMGLVAGLGWSIVWLSRPFESLMLLLLCCAFLVIQVFRAPGEWRKWVAPVATALLTLVPAGVITAAHNRAVTGFWTTHPYSHYQSEYGFPANLYWQPAGAEPVHRPPEIRALYAWQLAVRQDHADRWLRYGGVIAFWTWASFVTPWYSLPLVLAGFRWRDRRVLACGAVVTLALAACGVNAFFFPRYIAPYWCLVVFLIVRGLMLLSQWSILGRAVGRWVVLFLIAGGCLMGLRLVPVRSILGISSLAAKAGPRTQVQQKLESLGGRHVVVVRYGASHSFHDEWVYNAADVDTSPVVWCRALGPAEDVDVARYYKDRQVWWADVDEHSARLSRYAAGPRLDASTEIPPVGT